MTKTYKYTNITTKTTTTLKTSPAILHSITINTAGSGGNTITVDDQTTAATPTIATIDGAAVAGSTFLFDVNCLNGLVIVTATGTQADITVCWE